MKTGEPNEKIVIGGPCALESKEQLRSCVQALKELGISIIRASLWKPRTQPGWDGLGWMSLPLLLQETIPHGITPATEIISQEHAELVVDALEQFDKQAKMLVWLGSRNQNHIEQTKIAKVLAHGPKGITLMFKNQMWEDERHWLGICEHLLAGGIPKERLLACHRGFSPGKLANPHHFRNLPDYEMAMRVKRQLCIPMLIDPSHIGGSRANVFRVMQQAEAHSFDGMMVEVHINPKLARTDANQQLSCDEMKLLLRQTQPVELV